MVRDLIDQAKLAADTVERMSGGMQHLFPILLTLLAAVGGSNGSALFQPAVVAAAGTMTTAIHRVGLPLATSSALVSMVDHLGEENRFSRLASLLHTAATWTLGICFTVFLGVIVTQGLGASALDGVTIRTAKYALDNFIPVVGGLFADTVDTLVGGSLLIQNALGTTGLLLILGICLMPLMQTLGTVVLYRGTAAGRGGTYIEVHGKLCGGADAAVHCGAMRCGHVCAADCTDSGHDEPDGAAAIGE